jgi:Flp pilus assembly protein TadG
VEFALTVPLLLLLLLAAADFGRVMYWAITVSGAARAGAVYGARSQTTAADTSGIRQAASQEGQNIGISAGEIAVAVNCACPGQSAVPAVCTSSCTCPGTLTCSGGYSPPRMSVRVTVTKIFAASFLRIPGISPLSLLRNAELRVQ